MNQRRHAFSGAIAAAVALAFLSGMTAPGGTGAAFGATVDVSQTVRWYDQDEGNGSAGNATVAYSAVAATGQHWRARGSLSWWSWQANGPTAAPDDSGPGAAYLTLGRLVWTSYGLAASSRAWLQLKGTIPLQSSPSIASSGKFDWGGSLLTSNRYRDFLLFTEFGFLNLGDPAGVVYADQYSAAASVSWHPRQWPVYPVLSFVGAGATVEAGSGYGEWTAGLGAILGRRTGLSALYSQGTTAVSPQQGVTLVFSHRL